jgi:hypothetical protein
MTPGRADNFTSTSFRRYRLESDLVYKSQDRAVSLIKDHNGLSGSICDLRFLNEEPLFAWRST